MSVRSISLSTGEFYHVYNRGTDKRLIFMENADWERFTALLFLANSSNAISVKDVLKYSSSVYGVDRGQALVSIGAYCLMPNHFHILLQQKEGGGISKFIHKVTTGYTMYFNRKYERSGNLFQGIFKAEHAHSDEYLKYLFSYIHLNPVKLKQPDWRESGSKDAKHALQYALEYEYSSLQDYGSKRVVREKSDILTQDVFPDYFRAQSMEDELMGWLNFNPA